MRRGMILWVTMVSVSGKVVAGAYIRCNGSGRGWFYRERRCTMMISKVLETGSIVDAGTGEPDL